MISKRNIEIEVDGGINYKTAILAKEAGANILVAGEFIFSSNNYKEVIQGLRNV
ncbi:MAG: ribulose-phosphate 3-epimerase, partial [Candidatus Cloacimonetes bacterium]|nr:ribulose-phosphate 3-epimerase [Candidatus Cloacimonadota bacterium]